MEGSPLAGKRFYSPEVLLVYFAVGGLPAGVFLYGLNVARRGQPWTGHLLAALAAITFTLPALFEAAGWSSFGALSTFIGIGVLRSESGFFRAALAGGATPARWWPPAVLGIVLVLAVALMMELLRP